PGWSPSLSHPQPLEVALAALVLDVARGVDPAHPDLVLTLRQPPLERQRPLRRALGADVGRPPAARAPLGQGALGGHRAALRARAPGDRHADALDGAAVVAPAAAVARRALQPQLAPRRRDARRAGEARLRGDLVAAARARLRRRARLGVGKRVLVD